MFSSEGHLEKGESLSIGCLFVASAPNVQFRASVEKNNKNVISILQINLRINALNLEGEEREWKTRGMRKDRDWAKDKQKFKETEQA